MLGENREYLTIKILHNDMTVMVPCCNADKAGLRRVIGEDDVKKVLGRPPRRREPDAEELEPALQAQPREDQDRRRVRARRGRPQPRDPRAGEGALDGREADVHPREEDPRLRADVRARHGGGRGGGAPRGPDRRRAHRAATARPRRRSRSRPGISGVRGREPPVAHPSSGSFPPAAAANALVPTGPRRSSFVPAGRCSSGASRCSSAVCDRVVVAVPPASGAARTAWRAGRRARRRCATPWPPRRRRPWWSSTTPPGRSSPRELVEALPRRAGRGRTARSRPRR